MKREVGAKIKKFLWAALKIAACAAFTMVAIVTIMANMGGSSPMLKTALENYISSETGYAAHIRTLNRLSFYPAVGFDIEGLQLREPESGAVALMADQASFAVDFWDMTQGNGRFRNIHVRELIAGPGVILNVPVHVSEFGILDKKDEPPVLKLLGDAGTEAVEGIVALKAAGLGIARNYQLAGKRDFLLRLGQAELSGVQELNSSGFAVEDLRIVFGGQDVLRARADVSGGRPGLRVQGRLELPEGGSVFTPDIVFNRAPEGLIVSGTLRAESFDAGDFRKNSRLGRLISYLYPFFKNADGRKGLRLNVGHVDAAIAAPGWQKNIRLEDVRVYARPGRTDAADFAIEPARFGPPAP